MKRSTLFVVGCGTHYNSCHEVLEHQYKVEHLFDPKNAVISGERKFDIPITNFSEFQKNIADCESFFVAIGDNFLRANVFHSLVKKGYAPIQPVMHEAFVSKYAVIGKGTIIMPGSIIRANAIIGENCIINTGCVIEHDSVISDNCHIAPGAVICGSVFVESGCLIGANATILPNCKIEHDIKASMLVKT